MSDAPVKITGKAENAFNGYIEGWACDRNDPETKQKLELYIDGELVVEGETGLYREDLEASDVASAYSAFRFRLPEELCNDDWYEVDVRCAGQSLPHCPRRFQFKAIQWDCTGNLDRFDWPRVEGWAWNKTDPRARMDIEILCGPQVIDTFSANIHRDDLEQAEIGDGSYGFVAHLPEYLPPGKHAFRVMVKGANMQLNEKKLTVQGPEAKAAPDTCKGVFERLGCDVIEGWAWDSAKPDEPINVDVLVDDVWAHTAVADFYREDLQENGIGNGAHGFKIPVPAHWLDGSEHKVALRFGATDTALDESPRRELLQAAPEYIGSLDASVFPQVRGWAWNASDADEIVKIDLFLNDEKIAEMRANEWREDLSNAGIANGKRAFKHTISQSTDPSREYEIAARISGTDIHLKHSPQPLKFAVSEAEFRNGITRRGADEMPVADNSESPAELAAAIPRTTMPDGWMNAIKETCPDEARSAYHRAVLKASGQPCIVLPVYNAFVEVKACLEALKANTPAGVQLMIINDASTDERIEPLLEDFAENAGVTLLTNDQNLGFTQTVNRAIAKTDQDVILLNSDTQVTPRWLERLRITAWSDPSIATVTAVSDNSGAFSVPHSGTNTIPESLGRDAAGRVMSAASAGILPEGPTGNGFCMFIKRTALDDVGGFDAEAFPRGYGEENDFCMRALKAGWRHVTDDSVFVFHTRNASFGEEKQELIKQASKQMGERHPEYKELVTQFTQSSSMLKVRKKVQHALDAVSDKPAGSPDGLPRILYVLHGGATGGTPQTNADLMQSMQGQYDTFVLDCDFETITLKRFADHTFYAVEQWQLPRKISPTEINRGDYNAVIFEVLHAYNFELVHVRHLYKHMMSLPEIAHTLSIPVIMSFHDFYYVCPTVNLLDEKGTYCAGRCTASVPRKGDDCATPFNHVSLPPLKDQWVHVWRDKVRSMLAFADAFVTTSESARKLYLDIYKDELKDKPFLVIEHGRDFAEQEDISKEPEKGEILKILVPGHLTQHKGAELIEAVQEIDREHDNRLEFHFLGNLPHRYRHLGVHHGTYARGKFAEAAQKAGCHVTGIFSVWAETYCHTLSESWAVGMPVVATSYGALKERIDAHGGGWLVDAQKPVKVYKQLIAIADDAKDYKEKAKQAKIGNMRSTSEMGGDYAQLYQRMLNSRLMFADISFDKGA